MSGPATAISYEESVGSCGPPTPLTPPPPWATRSAPAVRRQLDFTGGGDLRNDDEFLCRVADDIERGYSEAKRRAPPCVCGRGLCKVERNDQSGQWKYACPSRPKCNHVVFCEEGYLNPKSEPTTRSHAKPSNPCTFNDMAGPKTAVNVCPQATGTATPVSVPPQVAGAMKLFSDSPQAAKLLVPSTRAKVPQGAEYNEEPICQCRAGKCKKARIGKEDWYVCPIPKGKGACSYKVLACGSAKDIVPSKSPMRPCSTPSPISPNSNNISYRCHEKGHWARDCPKQSPRGGACFKCGMVGHWFRNCPQL